MTRQPYCVHCSTRSGDTCAAFSIAVSSPLMTFSASRCSASSRMPEASEKKYCLPSGALGGMSARPLSDHPLGSMSQLQCKMLADNGDHLPQFCILDAGLSQFIACLGQFINDACFHLFHAVILLMVAHRPDVRRNQQDWPGKSSLEAEHEIEQNVRRVIEVGKHGNAIEDNPRR